jgi:ketosteroid isomerase-like protein
MGDHPNAELVRRGYGAFSSGDFDTLREVFADDIVWHVPGNNSLSGDYKGMEEVFGFFGQLVQGSGGSFKLDLHDVIGNDEHVVGLARLTAQKDGRSIESQVANVFHISDGKATEVWGLSDNSRAFDEFWDG